MLLMSDSVILQANKDVWKKVETKPPFGIRVDLNMNSDRAKMVSTEMCPFFHEGHTLVKILKLTCQIPGTSVIGAVHEFNLQYSYISTVQMIYFHRYQL